MGYDEALEAAGATIHEFREFGSYRGDWFALVTWRGETGWVSGNYGSCRGCDALEAKFGCSQDTCEDHMFNRQSGCPDCIAATKAYLERLAEFGETYLDGLMTQDQMEVYAEKTSAWNMEDKESLEWIKSCRQREEMKQKIWKASVYESASWGSTFSANAECTDGTFIKTEQYNRRSNAKRKLHRLVTKLGGRVVWEEQ